MDVESLNYFKYPDHKPPVIGLYVCKVACESPRYHQCGSVYMWGEWTGEGFDFGDRWDLRPDEQVMVTAWAYHAEHSRIQDRRFVRTDWRG